MYTQGMTFGTDGPIMTGSWYNPKTGDKFTVADTFFEDNQLLVKTVDGRLLSYEIIQNYIQQSANESNANFIQPTNTNSIPREVMDMIEPAQDSLYEPMGNLYNPTIVEQAQPILSNNQPIVDKALSKTSLPELNVELVWSKYPEREIEMLKDIMDVPIEDIIKWYVDKFDLNSIKQQISESIYNTLNKDVIQEISVADDALPSPEEDLSNKPRKTSKKTK